MNILYSSLTKILFIQYYIKGNNIMSKAEDEIAKKNKEEEEKKKKLLIEEKQPENLLPIGEGHETKVIDDDEEEEKKNKIKKYNCESELNSYTFF